LAECAGIAMPARLAALQDFAGLAHRCQWVINHEGVSWYNDSKATNVGAAKQAIEGIGSDTPGKLVVIAGGLDKNADFTPLRESMRHYVRQLLLIGRDAARIEQTLAGSVAIRKCESLEEAVALAQNYAESGDAVLLAPACASFDMFQNFEHRGEVFMTT